MHVAIFCIALPERGISGCSKKKKQSGRKCRFNKLVIIDFLLATGTNKALDELKKIDTEFEQVLPRCQW